MSCPLWVVWNSAYTYANGKWDLDGFLRYLQHQGVITNIAKDDLPVNPRYMLLWIWCLKSPDVASTLKNLSFDAG